MAGPELPAEYFPGGDVKYDGQVMPRALKLEVGKILYPRTGSGHARVAHTILRSAGILENGVLPKDVLSRWYFRSTTAAVTVLFTGRRHDDPGKVTNPPCASFAPSKMDCQSLNAVKGMLLVHCNEDSNAVLIFVSLPGWRAVVSSAVYP